MESADPRPPLERMEGSGAKWVCQMHQYTGDKHWSKSGSVSQISLMYWESQNHEAPVCGSLYHVSNIYCPCHPLLVPAGHPELLFFFYIVVDVAFDSHIYQPWHHTQQLPRRRRWQQCRRLLQRFPRCNGTSRQTCGSCTSTPSSFVSALRRLVMMGEFRTVAAPNQRIEG